MKTKTLVALLALGALAGAAYEGGLLQRLHSEAKAPPPPAAAVTAPAVSVARVAPYDFKETVLVTGSLIPREEIMVAPEVEGLRVLALKADEGDRVKKGDVLAVLVSETLDAQIAQSDAALARTTAAISQSKSQITEAEARLKEARASLQRAKPLTKSGYMADSVYDQREAAANTAAAQLAAAQDGLKFAQAQKGEVEAQRREITWRRGNAEVKAPADGVISRRGARIGAIAVGSMAGAGGEPLFRIIANGEIELDAEVSETQLGRISAGQKAVVEAAGGETVEGSIRLVSPEVDKATRLGRVKIFLGDNPALKIGAFARGSIETARSRNLAVPQSAILYGDHGATVQVVVDGKVSTRRIGPGLSADGRVEILAGLSEGDMVVAKAGTFLRDGDAVRPQTPADKVSEAVR